MVGVIPTSPKLVGEVQLSRLRDTLVILFNLRRGNLVDESMPIANQQCAYEAYGCVVSPQKALEKEETIIAASQVLMIMPGMVNVALVVIAADYSQQSHCCEVTTAHSFKGTTDTQLTTFESLRTRTWTPPLGSSVNSTASPISSSPLVFV